METLNWLECVVGLVLGGGISVVANRYLKYGFVYVVAGLVVLILSIGWTLGWDVLLEQSMVLWLPMLFLHTISYGLVDYYKDAKKSSKVFEVKLKVKGRPLVLGNIRRGVSVMASAGSGKTESVIYGFLDHFKKEEFSGWGIP